MEKVLLYINSMLIKEGRFKAILGLNLYGTLLFVMRLEELTTLRGLT